MYVCVSFSACVCVCVCVCAHLDDDVAFARAAAVQLAVFLHHDDLALLLHLVRVLLHVVEDAPVVLLGHAHKLLPGDNMGETRGEAGGGGV